MPPTSTAVGVERVRATPAALAVLARLTAQHGPLLLHQSGGCCDGSAPMCYPRNDFIVGDRDVLLGVLDAGGDARVPAYIGGAQFEYWSHTELTIDVVPGRGSGFSLEAPEGVRFLTRSRLFTDTEADALRAAGPAQRGGWEEAPEATVEPTQTGYATPAQVAELLTLAALVGEEVPAGMRPSEAAQRLDELRRMAGRATRPVAVVPLPD